MPVKRGPGRPPKARIDTNSANVNMLNPSVAAALEAGVLPAPDIADADLDQYGGDLDALASWSARSGKPFASRSSYGASSVGYLPDLSPRGTLVFRHDPTKQFNFKWHEEDGSREARKNSLVMKQKRYFPATASDFIVCPELRGTIVPDHNDRLVIADMAGNASAVIMVRSQEDWVRDRKELLRHSDDLQITAEEKALRLQEQLRGSGMRGVRASSSVSDD